MRDLSKTLLVAAVISAAGPVAHAAPTAKGLGSAGASASSPLIGDVRCMLTMVAFGSAKERQQAAQVGADFFAGRISARYPTAAMAEAIKSQAPQMRPADFETEFKRCAPIVGAYTQALQSTLVSLRPPAQPAAPAPASPPPAAAAPPPH